MKRKIHINNYRRKGKIVRDHDKVIKVANKVKNKLEPYSYKIQIAGSIRRKKSNPSDVDLVLIPKNKEKIANELKKMKAKFKAHGPKQIFTTINGVDTDIFMGDKDSYGALLLSATGSGNHNIGLRKLAKKQHKLLNQYGLYNLKTNKKLAGETEAGIYKALGRPKLTPPEQRN